jgi:murein DD-endopeptidase MepM/ murein hydrolase activator NlpD
MKGDVVFYSHLDEISVDLKEWDFVRRGQLLWKTWVSGVPETDYDDFHLHFTIMKNPYILERSGSYDFWDYMAWDWITKWMSQSETLAAQKETFE